MRAGARAPARLDFLRSAVRLAVLRIGASGSARSRVMLRPLPLIAPGRREDEEVEGPPVVVVVRGSSPVWSPSGRAPALPAQRSGREPCRAAGEGLPSAPCRGGRGRRQMS